MFNKVPRSITPKDCWQLDCMVVWEIQISSTNLFKMESKMEVFCVHLGI
jgi:hypothetical protein